LFQTKKPPEGGLFIKKEGSCTRVY